MSTIDGSTRSDGVRDVTATPFGGGEYVADGELVDRRDGAVDRGFRVARLRTARGEAGGVVFLVGFPAVDHEVRFGAAGFRSHPPRTGSAVMVDYPWRLAPDAVERVLRHVRVNTRMKLIFSGADSSN